MNEELEVPFSAVIVIILLIVLLVAGIFGPSACSSIREQNIRADEFQKITSDWDKECRDQGNLLVITGRGGNPDALCVGKDGRVLRSR
jgi:hypothetical protein